MSFPILHPNPLNYQKTAAVGALGVLATKGPVLSFIYLLV